MKPLTKALAGVVALVVFPAPAEPLSEHVHFRRIPARRHWSGTQDLPRGARAHVISIGTFGDELRCLPEFHSQDNGAWMWSIDPTHLPKKGAPVTLRLRLKKDPKP